MPTAYFPGTFGFWLRKRDGSRDGGGLPGARTTRGITGSCSRLWPRLSRRDRCRIKMIWLAPASRPWRAKRQKVRRSAFLADENIATLFAKKVLRRSASFMEWMKL